MDSSLKNFLDQFFNFKIAGKRVTIPYWMNKLDKEIYGPHGGKGTPEEVRLDTIEAAHKENLDLGKMSSDRIYSLMKRNRIGLDCSGYAYQILNFLDLERGGDGLENSIVGDMIMGIRKTNADALTNNINSFPVQDYNAVKKGDTIRVNGGKHMMVIVSVDLKAIVYTHIASNTEIDGPHLAKIKIINPNKGPEDQDWEEKTKDGQNYKEYAFRANLGDGIRRLKIFM